jgi:hypothetical protein
MSYLSIGEIFPSCGAPITRLFRPDSVYPLTSPLAFILLLFVPSFAFPFLSFLPFFPYFDRAAGQESTGSV